MDAAVREPRYYHALAVRAGGGYRELDRLQKGAASWEAAWQDIPSDERARFDPDALWEALAASGIRLVLENDGEYPPLLKEIPWAPFGLYVVGAPLNHAVPAVAIVGTRRATPEGIDIARRFAETLARAGVTIVSGLALGIDAAAHAGCLDANGRTIAVLANGPDTYRPRMNERLADRLLASGGTIVSEYPPGLPALPHRFIERNRIVSGLARGVLIAEAPERSGSLATARFATEQNRDLFVIPGPATHPNYRGSHALIRAGAELVTAPEDILASLGLAEAGRPAALPLGLDDDETAVIRVLQQAERPLTVDKIIELTTLEAQSANRALTTLIIRNVIVEHGDGYALDV
jgi:DNA processing protein